MDKRGLPIGFFDSGVGGLSVLCHAVGELPCENFIYYGDDAHAPYGTKGEQEIKELSLACGEMLYQKGVKAIVMACNTATSAAVLLMREKYQIPVISMEPAVKPASESAAKGKIIVMATPSTIAGARYQALTRRVGCVDRLFNLPCDGLVELLETGEFENPEIEAYIRRKFSALEGQVVSGIVIGCTHYSFVSDLIAQIAREMFQGACEIHDGMFGTVRQLRRVLRQRGLEANVPGGRVELYTSGSGDTLEIMRKIMRQRQELSSR